MSGCEQGRTVAETHWALMAEIETLEKGGPIAMADYTIVNSGSPEALEAAVDGLIDAIGA